MKISPCIPFVVLALAQPVTAAPIEDPDPEPETPIDQLCDGAIQVKYDALFGSGINLGIRVGAMRIHSQTWCSQAYTGGRIHTNAPTGDDTTAVYGPVLAEYALVGYEAFGRALNDPFTDPTTGAIRSRFTGGFIVSHPTLGTHAIYNALGTLYNLNNTNIPGITSARFGYPTTDQIANPYGLPGGAYTWFEHGYTAKTDDFGTWIDFTGNGEGFTSATVTLYQDANFLGSSLARSFTNPSPVALRPQLGTLDERTSSLAVAMPTRTSLYLFADSPLEGRYVRISGADNATVKVANIGTWMNERTSSMLFVNHGTASGRSTVADLQTQIKVALDALNLDELMDTALAGRDATGWMSWNNSEVTVELVPGERLLKFSRRAYMDIDGPYWTDADGTVEFVVYVRPYIASDFKVHVWFLHGDAVSISCDGWACDDRNAALADLFSDSSTQALVETAFNASLDTKLAQLPALAGQCAGISARRVNVLPNFIEVVVADSATAATCAAPVVAQYAPGLIEFARPRGRVENSDGTVITSGVTIASSFLIMK